MNISILIVTQNRPDELEITLNNLIDLIDLSIHEVLILIDYCPATEKLIQKYPWVKWEVSKVNLGASPARNKLYKKAIGKILVGLDDDAHPVSQGFILQVEDAFSSSDSLGIVAFQEVRGLYESDVVAMQNANFIIDDHLTNDFIGCGFAIRKEVYDSINGFPIWMDIYGEESCVALEVIDLGYDILYKNNIIINHRINKESRIKQGRYYFRFERQLRNTFFYYLVYYKKPLPYMAKLLYHNFKKYALSDLKYFKLYFKSFFIIILKLSYVMQYRKPVKESTLKLIQTFGSLKY